eukprot:20944-Heterococcus_DN1.PRE.4
MSCDEFQYWRQWGFIEHMKLPKSSVLLQRVLQSGLVQWLIVHMLFICKYRSVSRNLHISCVSSVLHVESDISSTIRCIVYVVVYIA